MADVASDAATEPLPDGAQVLSGGVPPRVPSGTPPAPSPAGTLGLRVGVAQAAATGDAPVPATGDARGLGQRIASLRHAAGWSQRRLAEAAGVSHGYVALLELGRLPSPGKFRLDAIARALNLPTADALTDAEVPVPVPVPASDTPAGASSA